MDFEIHAARIEATLEKFGGLYNFADIVGMLEDGEMQMFAEGNSICVTKVADFPRKRMLDIVLVYGNIEEVLKLQNRVYEYAKEVEADLIGTMMGRTGWESQMLKGDGWRVAGTVYLKEL